MFMHILEEMFKLSVIDDSAHRLTPLTSRVAIMDLATEIMCSHHGIDGCSNFPSSHSADER
jgi:hypothetical protein